MNTHLTQRQQWAAHLHRLADPILSALAHRRLRATMPVRGAEADVRRPFTYLEAFGRLLAGIGPWLECSESEGDPPGETARWRTRTAEALDAATDPASPDRMSFFAEGGEQALVDAAFLAQGLLRAPTLWASLDARVQQQVVGALRETRAIRPSFNNWLLFAAIIEAFFHRAGESFDPMRVDYALRQHEQWYLGDGTYSDGPHLHWDYYNSYVIHPMLLDTLDAVADAPEAHPAWIQMRDDHRRRAHRFAIVLERMIAADGSFPPMGRSLTYRAGAFHLLGQMALRRDLPQGLAPGQVREAMTRVLHRTLDAPGTFDEHGWLQHGVCGHQPALAEHYISTGSLYLTACGLLPLGLPANDPFWTEPGIPTCDRVWSGQDVPADRAID